MSDSITRFYFALTNNCNRSCEYCSCFSRPGKKTFLDFEKFKEYLSIEKDFEIQMEGGEPLLHPQIKQMIAWAQQNPHCKKIVLGTNGVLLPFAEKKGKIDAIESRKSLTGFFTFISVPFTIKLSINYHLYEADHHLFDKAVLIKNLFHDFKKYNSFQLILNVRRRKLVANHDDEWIIHKLKEYDLTDISNIFYYQRYGFASDRAELDRPFVVENPVDFYLIDPEGNNWKQDLMARSEAMRNMA